MQLQMRCTSHAAATASAPAYRPRHSSRRATSDLHASCCASLQRKRGSAPHMGQANVGLPALGEARRRLTVVPSACPDSALCDGDVSEKLKVRLRERRAALAALGLYNCVTGPWLHALSGAIFALHKAAASREATSSAEERCVGLRHAPCRPLVWLLAPHQRKSTGRAEKHRKKWLGKPGCARACAHACSTPGNTGVARFAHLHRMHALL